VNNANSKSNPKPNEQIGQDISKAKQPNAKTKPIKEELNDYIKPLRNQEEPGNNLGNQ
jgi:hypothetical protein